MLPVRRSRVVFACWVAVAALGGRPCNAQEELLGELKSVADVSFEGRRHVSERELRSVTKTRAPSWLPWSDRPTLRLDFLRSDTLAITSLYKHYGYLDTRASFRVASTRRPDEVAVIFMIDEGSESRVRRIELTGLSAYPEDALRNRLWAHQGRPFDPAYLQLDTLRISELYQERGYRPHVTARQERESLSVVVHYDVNEGPQYRVGEVYVTNREANVTVDERLLRRELLLKPGQVYRRSRVDRSVERLYESGLFSQVQVTPLPDSTNTQIEFFFAVRERKPRWIDAGVGSGTSERFRFTGQWGHRNLLGQGLQGALGSKLTFAAVDGNVHFQLFRAEATLLEPWLLRTRTRGTITPFYERSDDRAEQEWFVSQEAKGVNFQLRRELSRYSRVTLTQSNVFATQDLHFTDPTVPDSTADSLANAIVSRYTTHRLGLGVERDFRDNPLDATRGSVQAINGEIAGGPFKGKSSFRKAQVTSSWYTPMRNGWVLASKLRAGFIVPFGDTARFSVVGGTDEAVQVDREVARIPLEDRFRAGGVNSIRGYGENQVARSGGLAVVTANLELRIPIAGPFGIELFADAGNVWARPEYMRWNQFRPRIGRTPLGDSDVRYVVGLGPRVKLPIGPLRVDFSWILNPGKPEDGGPRYGKMVTQFAIGPSF